MEYLSTESKTRRRTRTLQGGEEEQSMNTGNVQYCNVEPWGVDGTIWMCIIFLLFLHLNTLTNLIFFVKNTGSCPANVEDVTCQKFGSLINIYVNGTIPEETLRDRIFTAFNLFDTLVTDQMGVFDMQLKSIELETRGDGAGIIDGGVDSDGSKDRVNTEVVIGSVAAGLAMFLLTLLCVVFFQRQPSGMTMSHSRLEDETEEEESQTFKRHVEKSGRGVQRDANPRYEYETRVIPLESSDLRSEVSQLEIWSPYSIGDDTAMTEEDRLESPDTNDIFWVNHPRDRTHQCSAATCEICERRRQMGVLAEEYESMRIRPPPSPELAPSYDPNRWFISEDTVEL
jgi:hypothetical protein